ncbi:hypothetical protein [Bradyrhizobium prioriisuperbiae]|uniref:hypothetical protein n=1 Tax=Bradyrhizobium prioriisuperbiae TaxID=2854389 RepID=UPI0028F0F5C7|nr:hypothetical protein [Bradyrhizobium prioritasuperba]
MTMLANDEADDPQLGGAAGLGNGDYWGVADGQLPSQQMTVPAQADDHHGAPERRGLVAN